MNKIGKSIDEIEPRTFKILSNKLMHLVESRLWLQVIIALILGSVVGIFVSPTYLSTSLSSVIVEWLSLPGSIFIGIIQMVVIPLIFASIILGIASAKSLIQLKKIGILTAIFFVFITIVAIILGIFLSISANPGDYISSPTVENKAVEPIDADISVESIPSHISNLIPTNFFSSLIRGEMLPIIVFALIFGIALISIKSRQARPIVKLMESLQTVCMTIVKFAMYLAPIAVFGLMAKMTSQFGLETLVGLSVYVGVVIFGLFLLFLVYMLIVYITAGIHPSTFLFGTKELLLLAFSTSSSAVVMPLSVKTAEEKFEVRESVANFVIPIGTTVNMAGTALYQGIATIFLAQVYGIELTITGMVLLILTIIGVSIGTPGTPGVGIVVLSMVLTSVGIPLAGIALILGIDRLLEMARTSLNVSGDIVASIFVDRQTRTKASLAELKDNDNE